MLCQSYDNVGGRPDKAFRNMSKLQKANKCITSARSEDMVSEYNDSYSAEHLVFSRLVQQPKFRTLVLSLPLFMGLNAQHCI